jgi:NIPSNAP protein
MAANNMLYDVTILGIRPAGTPKTLPLLNEWIMANKGRGELLACWYTEIGALNRVLIIRGYADEASLGADRTALADREDRYGIGELLTAAESDTYLAFDFIEPMKPGSYGPVYEVRTYLLKPGGLAGTREAWRKSIPERMKLSRVTAALYSVTGTTPRFMHIWPYASLEERQRIRKEAVEKKIWPPPGGPERLLTQQTDIYLPAPFSPLK